MKYSDSYNFRAFTKCYSVCTWVLACYGIKFILKTAPVGIIMRSWAGSTILI